MAAADVVHFDDYRLDMPNAQLWRGEELVKLSPKALSVLDYLVNRPGQLVSKDELFEAVWPEVVVGEGAMAECIREVRKALGETARAPRYVETVHRRGYRFIGQVKETADPSVSSGSSDASGSSDSSSPTPQVRSEPEAARPVGTKPKQARTVWRRGVQGLVGVLFLLGAVLAVRQFGVERPPGLPLPDRPSIAVLPFTNMSGDPEQEYFSDGMTDDIITDLSKISGLFVIARHSVFTYKGQAVEVGEVGRELGVRYVLEGSVRKADGRVRINAQLIDASTGGHVWAERYDRELADIFALQDEVTQQIVTMLRVEMQAAEQERVRRIPTANLSAYDAWLRGLDYYWRTTPAGNVKARQLFERAVALDPQYAEAYAWLGITYWMEWGAWRQDPPLLTRAGELVRQALALDDALPDAHALMGLVYVSEKQFEQARAEGARAVALDPNYADAHAHLAQILTVTGRAAEAIGVVQQAMRLNPHYPPYYTYNLGVAYAVTGQYADAIATLQDAVRRNPNFLAAYSWLGVSYVAQWAGQWSEDPQDLERAAEAARQAVVLSDVTHWTHGWLSNVYLWQKRHAEALAEAERALALNPHEAQSHMFVSDVLNFTGRAAESRARMEQVDCATSFYVSPPLCFAVLGDALYLTRQYEEALVAYHQALSHNPRVFYRRLAHLGLAASYSELGRQDEARAEVTAVLDLNPQFSLAGIEQRWPYQDPADLERFLAALRNAGLK